MSRYLPDVIDQMLEVIPHMEDSLIRKLESVKESAAFAAPEMQYLWWTRCYAVLNDFVSDEDNEQSDWTRKLVEIWKSKEEPANE